MNFKNTTAVPKECDKKTVKHIFEFRYFLFLYLEKKFVIKKIFSNFKLTYFKDISQLDTYNLIHKMAQN